MLAEKLAEPLSSPLPNVSPAQWYAFVLRLDVQPIKAVSLSGGFGSYDLRPRRLVELGYMTGLKSTRLQNRWIHSGTFVSPLTKSKLLTDPGLQYKILVRSLSAYDEELRNGLASNTTRAGALAILHRGGRGALKSYNKNGSLFSDTEVIFNQTKELF